VTQPQLADRVLRTYLATGRAVSTKQLKSITHISVGTLRVMLAKNRSCYFAPRIDVGGTTTEAWLPDRKALRKLVRLERADYRLYQRDFAAE